MKIAAPLKRRRWLRRLRAHPRYSAMKIAAPLKQELEAELERSRASYSAMKIAAPLKLAHCRYAVWRVPGRLFRDENRGSIEALPGLSQ